MSTTYLPVPGTASPRGLRAVIVTSALIGALLLVGNSVFAALNATASNTVAHGVSTGTLSLTMTENGVGFGTESLKMVPGDVIRRFVNLTNTGDLEGKLLTLSASAAASKITTDATNGLHVVLDSCATAWTHVGSDYSASTCAGGSTPILSTSLSALRTAPVGLTGYDTTVAAGAVLYLRLSVSLPDQSETTVNGNVTADMIQGKTASITWTFEEQQKRAADTYTG